MPNSENTGQKIVIQIYSLEYPHRLINLAIIIDGFDEASSY
jgi:hypothetical protein